MAITGKVAADIRHVEGVAKNTLTTQRKIAQMKLNAQTIKKTTPLFQDFVTYTKKKGNT